jgi:adenosylmethionine-8-amino-7-oxononanoate aminotransferase
MVTHTPTQVEELQRTALEHLWVYLREPSDMAEKGEPQIFVDGKGCQVTDALGNTYTDAMSGLWLKNVGYGRTEIADAAYEQMLKLTYMPMGTTTEPTIRLAEKIASIMPGDLSRCFFTSGGSESVETAMKLARAYFKRVGEPTRVKFISRKGSYHGATFGTLALGGTAIFPKVDYEPLLAGCFHGPQPLPYRCEYGGTTPEECAELCVKAIEDIIRFQGPQTVAAVIAEPVSSPLGAVVPGPNYWPMLREVCDRHGCLLIADEVITGFGRTGKLFALDHWGVEPDMMQFAKAVTSGYFPFGGVGVNDRIAELLDDSATPWMHAYTYSAHPVGCAVALRTMDIILDEDFPAQAAAKGEHLLAGLKAALADHPNVGDVRGKGLMCGVEIVQDKATKAEFPASENIGVKVHAATQQRGLFSRLRGDVFCLAPPVVTTTEQLDRIVEILAAAIDEVLPA